MKLKWWWWSPMFGRWFVGMPKNHKLIGLKRAFYCPRRPPQIYIEMVERIEKIKAAGQKG